jgi:hypothetical protein
MKKQDLDLMRPDRREFALAAVVAMLGGVAITISGCGGKSGSPAAPSTPPPDNNGAIANNHGHVAVVTSAELTLDNGVLLNIQGTASHNHTLELSADEILQVRDGRTVAKQSSSTSHSHMVTFN